MNSNELKYDIIIKLLEDVKIFILNDLQVNPYDDIDKIINVCKTNGINNDKYLKKRLKNLTMLLYSRNLESSKSIIEKLNEAYLIL